LGVNYESQFKLDVIRRIIFPINLSDSIRTHSNSIFTILAFILASVSRPLTRVKGHKSINSLTDNEVGNLRRIANESPQRIPFYTLAISTSWFKQHLNPSASQYHDIQSGLLIQTYVFSDTMKYMESRFDFDPFIFLSNVHVYSISL
jgi:hypothetical protein